MPDSDHALGLRKVHQVCRSIQCASRSSSLLMHIILPQVESALTTHYWGHACVGPYCMLGSQTIPVGCKYMLCRALQAGQMLLHLRVSSNNRMLPFTMQLIELISDRSADAALISPAGASLLL